MVEKVDNADEESNMALAAVLAAVAVLCVSVVAAFLIYRYYKRRSSSDMNFDNPVYKKTTTVDDGVNMNQRFVQNGLRNSSFQHRQYGVSATEDSAQPLTKDHQVV